MNPTSKKLAALALLSVWTSCDRGWSLWVDVVIPAEVVGTTSPSQRALLVVRFDDKFGDSLSFSFGVLCGGDRTVVWEAYDSRDAGETGSTRSNSTEVTAWLYPLPPDDPRPCGTTIPPNHKSSDMEAPPEGAPLGTAIADWSEQSFCDADGQRIEVVLALPASP